MSKYLLLWQWIKENRQEDFILTYDEIEKILGFKIDHSFLSFKKEILEFGFNVEKISLKEQTIKFKK